MVVTGTHDPYLVALSILVASFASYTALDLSGHVGTARGFARSVWLVAAAITMGGGIWSMHFVAMLAFIMPIPMSYDIGLTTLSPRAPRHLHGTWHCRHALHRHGGNAGARRTQLRPAICCALSGHSDRRIDGGTMAGIPNHGSWAKARCRGRHGPGHFRYALHGEESGHVHRSPPGSRGPSTPTSRLTQSGAGGSPPYPPHPGSRVGRPPVRAEASRRSA